MHTHSSLKRSLLASSVHGIFQARILDGLPFLPLGIFPGQGIKAASLHWQVDSLLLSHQAQTGSNSALQINVYLEPQVMTLFGSRDFADVIRSNEVILD